jgi:hypothetical protein
VWRSFYYLSFSTKQKIVRQQTISSVLILTTARRNICIIKLVPVFFVLFNLTELKKKLEISTKLNSVKYRRKHKKTAPLFDPPKGMAFPTPK